MNPPILNRWALKFHLQRLMARMTGRNANQPRSTASSSRAVERNPNPPALDDLMDLETVATYAGVHPTTIRRWLRDEKIPAPVKRFRRRLYWTPDDAWIIKVQNLPGDYHAEIVEPVERNSTGSDSETEIGDSTR